VPTDTPFLAAGSNDGMMSVEEISDAADLNDEAATVHDLLDLLRGDGKFSNIHAELRLIFDPGGT